MKVLDEIKVRPQGQPYILRDINKDSNYPDLLVVGDIRFRAKISRYGVSVWYPYTTDQSEELSYMTDMSEIIDTILDYSEHLAKVSNVMSIMDRLFEVVDFTVRSSMNVYVDYEGDINPYIQPS